MSFSKAGADPKKNRRTIRHGRIFRTALVVNSDQIFGRPLDLVLECGMLGRRGHTLALKHAFSLLSRAVVLFEV